MTEDATPADRTSGPGEQESAGSGHPVVDEVLGSLNGLDEAAVATHVAVFEQAHERLRGVLDQQH